MKTQQKIKRSATLVQYQDSAQQAIKIMFPFNTKDLECVKTLPGRRFNGAQQPKHWVCPLSIEAVQLLKEWGFELDEALEAFSQNATVSVHDIDSSALEIPGLKMELFPFQKKGVAFIEAKNGRALISDEMGLGKTAQALAWLQLHPEKRPVIIVVPASLKLNWEREIKMWMGDVSVQILSGKKADTPLIGEILIINYDILSAWVGRLQKIKASVLITDEAHFYKSNKSQRTKAIKALGKSIPHVIALSGTPIVNRPIEMFNALQMVDRTVVPDFWHYARRYCGAKHTHFGWDFTGASNTDELHQKLIATCMIRRLKKDVLLDLPDKLYSFMPFELSNAKEYRKAEQDFIQWLREVRGDEAARKAKGAETLTKIEVLKQLAVQGKMPQAIEWIQNFLDVGNKLVVFATHKFVIEALMNAFGDIAVRIDGSVTGADRDKAVQKFQNNEKIRLFVGNIKAAGVGLTLTAASNVAFLEFPWTPGDLSQAEDRCHRIGQKDSVTVYYLLSQNSIEEKIVAMLDSKRRILDQILDGKETSQENLLSELLNAYKGEDNV